MYRTDHKEGVHFRELPGGSGKCRGGPPLKRGGGGAGCPAKAPRAGGKSEGRGRALRRVEGGGRRGGEGAGGRKGLPGRAARPPGAQGERMAERKGERRKGRRLEESGQRGGGGRGAEGAPEARPGDRGAGAEGAPGVGGRGSEEM